VPDVKIFKDFGQKFEADQKDRIAKRRRLEKENKERGWRKSELFIWRIWIWIWMGYFF